MVATRRRRGSESARLTEAIVTRFARPQPGPQRFLRDLTVRGLALRVTPSGAAAWVWEQRVKRQKRRLVIGRPPEMNVYLARQAAIQMAARVSEGQDPAEARVADRGIPTLGTFAQRYMQEWATPRKRSAA